MIEITLVMAIDVILDTTRQPLTFHARTVRARTHPESSPDDPANDSCVEAIYPRMIADIARRMIQRRNTADLTLGVSH